MWRPERLRPGLRAARKRLAPLARRAGAFARTRPEVLLAAGLLGGVTWMVVHWAP